jgi:hypothetical protein
MLGLIASEATLFFPAGRALKLVKNGVNIISSTNPLLLTKNITLTIEDYHNSGLNVQTGNGKEVVLVKDEAGEIFISITKHNTPC